MKIRQRLLFLLTPLALLPLLLVTVFSLFLLERMNSVDFPFYETLAIIFVLLTAVVVIVMIVDAANSIAKPLRALTDTARKVAEGDLEVVAQVPFHSFELEQFP